MISNERQYRLARSQLRRLRQSLPGKVGSAAGPDPHSWPAVQDVQTQTASLEDQIVGYERLKRAAVSGLKIGSLRDLPQLLVMARIAQGLTQKALARRLGMKEQQIQRYEASHYRSASFQRLLQVAAALRVDVRLAPLRRVSTPKLDPAIARQTLDGFAEVNRHTAAERRARLRGMSEAEARRIYDDLVATGERLQAREAPGELPIRARIEHKLSLRRALERLAQSRDLT